VIGLVRGLARLLAACAAIVGAVVFGFVVVALSFELLAWLGVP
jgi:hypothetical protein